MQEKIKSSLQSTSMVQEKIKNLENKKIAIVCDWIKDWGGAELVFGHLLEIFPKADIFTSLNGYNYRIFYVKTDIKCFFFPI